MTKETSETFEYTKPNGQDPIRVDLRPSNAKRYAVIFSKDLLCLVLGTTDSEFQAQCLKTKKFHRLNAGLKQYIDIYVLNEEFYGEDYLDEIDN